MYMIGETIVNQTFPDLVKNENQAAIEKYGPINSLHEGYGVLAEEVAEFFDEVRKKNSEREPDSILGELVQIGAMAQRIAEDLQFIPPAMVTPASAPDSNVYAKRIEELEGGLTAAITLLQSARISSKQLPRPSTMGFGHAPPDASSMRELTFVVDEIKALEDILNA